MVEAIGLRFFGVLVGAIAGAGVPTGIGTEPQLGSISGTISFRYRECRFD